MQDDAIMPLEANQSRRSTIVADLDDIKSLDIQQSNRKDSAYMLELQTVYSKQTSSKQHVNVDYINELGR